MTRRARSIPRSRIPNIITLATSQTRKRDPCQVSVAGLLGFAHGTPVAALSACASDTAEESASHAASHTDSASSAAPDAAPTPAVLSGGAELIALGDAAFNDGFCQKCHNAGGIGGDRAPNLTDDEWVQCDGTIEGIRSVIISGVPEEKHSKPGYPFGMNGAAMMKLDDATVDALAAYVHSLSQ